MELDRNRVDNAMYRIGKIDADPVCARR